jgi:serralysin
MAFSDPVATPISGNPYIDGLSWGMHWDDPGSTKTRLNVYVAGVGGSEAFDFGGSSVTAETLEPEVTAFKRAMQLIENVCNIDFQTATSKSDADIIVGAVDDADADYALGVSVPPGEDFGPLSLRQGASVVNYDAYSTADFSSLKQGGYDFVTFIHELLHSIGLKHPHDHGGGSEPLFPGVSNGAEFGDFGDFNLNQGIYTTMSYNDGYATNPEGRLSTSVVGYGHQGTPMALDIAALQHMYGANTSFHAGNNTYTLPSANGAGTFYSCIWDAGGTDMIANDSGLKSHIDLRPATIAIAIGGGGYLSSVTGIYGGYTIARGALIENATGGSARDIIMGNGISNVLAAGGGNDVLNGAGGNDTLTGGSGADRFVYKQLSQSHKGGDTIADFSPGRDLIDVSAVDANALQDGNQAFVFAGAGSLTGEAGEIRFQKLTGLNETIVRFDVDGDQTADMVINLSGLISLSVSDFIL